MLIFSGHEAAEHAHVADARAQLVERGGDVCLGHVPVELHEEDVDAPLLVAVGVRLDEGQVDRVAVEGRQRRREPARLRAGEMDAVDGGSGTPPPLKVCSARLPKPLHAHGISLPASSSRLKSAIDLSAPLGGPATSARLASTR